MSRSESYLLLIVLGIWSSACNSQQLSKPDFIKKISANLEVDFNISYIPIGFYDCAYDVYTKEGGLEFDIGYSAAKNCLPDYLDKLKFSDKGIKLLASFKDAYVVACSRTVKEHAPLIHTGRYCECIHEQLVKYEMGFEDLIRTEFQNSTFFKKTLEYCWSVSER